MANPITAIMIDHKRNDHFYVITGGPGVGKTTLLNALKSHNCEVIPEIARRLIKEQQASNGEALPWKNKVLYMNLMFNRSIESFKQTEEKYNKSIPIFFDRGFLDSICYANMIGATIDEDMKNYAKKWRYNINIFFLPPWKEIYETDNERKQNWDEAILTSEKMKKTYITYGYKILEVPMRTTQERVDFVLSHIS